MIEVKDINGVMVITMDGKEVLGTDTHGQRALIEEWLTVLGQNTAEIMAKYDAEKASA